MSSYIIKMKLNNYIVSVYSKRLQSHTQLNRPDLEGKKEEGKEKKDLIEKERKISYFPRSKAQY